MNLLFIANLFDYKIQNVFRDEQNVIPMPRWDENNEGEATGDDEILLSSDNPGSNYVVPFNDPFDETIKYNSKEFLEECCLELEREEVLFRVIFEDLLNGAKNKMIAHKYNLPVRRIENIRKTISRRVLQISKTKDYLNSS